MDFIFLFLKNKNKKTGKHMIQLSLLKSLKNPSNILGHVKLKPNI
jgi:hypothetical protein